MSYEANGPTDVIVASTTYPGVSSVRLYLSTMQHIEDGHPEVATEAGVDGVIEAVGNPTAVYASNRPKSLIFVSENVRYINAVLNVPVKLLEDDSAKVVTAYFKSRKTTFQVVWSKDNVG